MWKANLIWFRVKDLNVTQIKMHLKTTNMSYQKPNLGETGEALKHKSKNYLKNVSV